MKAAVINKSFGEDKLIDIKYNIPIDFFLIDGLNSVKFLLSTVMCSGPFY